MKARILFVLLVLLSCGLFSQEIAIRQASNVHWDRLHINTSDNHTFVIWGDGQSGNTEIYVQKLDASGNLIWSDPLSFGVADVYNSACAAVRSSDNANLVLFYTFQYPRYNYYLAKFDDSGNMLWPNPLLLFSNEDYLGSYNIVANSVGGAYFVYTQDFYSGTITGQNINGNGMQLWNAEGITLLSNDDRAQINSLIPDGEGGFVLNCYLTSPDWQTHTRLIRFSADGSVVGPNPLIPDLSYSMRIKNVIATTDGNLLLFSANSLDGPSLYMQLIDMMGNPLGNTVQYTLPTAYEYTQFVVKASPAGGVVCGWTYNSSSVLYTRCQSFDAALQAQWNTDGVLVSENSWHYRDLQLTPDLAGGVWVNSYDKIYYVNPSGESVHTDGIDFSPYRYKNPLLLAGNNRVSLFWRQELDRSLSLSRQVINTDGSALFATGGTPIISHLAGFAHYSQTFAMNNSYIVTWYDSRIGNKDTKICYQVLDNSGQALLETNGRELNPNSDSIEDQIACLKLDNDHLAIYYGITDLSGQRFLQVLDASGNKLIDGYGLSVPIPSSSSVKLDSYQGDLYFGWIDETDGYRLMGQRVSNLQKQWGDNGMVLLDLPQSIFAFISGLSGRYYIYTTEDYNSNEYTSKAILVDASGSILPAWAPVGLQIVNPDESYLQYTFATTLWGEDLVTLTSVHQSYLHDCYAQKMSPEGDRLWGHAGAFVPNISENNSDPQLWVDDALSFLYLDPVEYSVLRYQRVGSTGLPLYPYDGFPVTPGEGYYGSFDLLGFNNGSQVAVYSTPTDLTGYYISYSDIVYQYINPGGEPLSDIHELCSARYEQKNPSAAGNGSFALVSWTDHRVGEHSEDYAFSSIYASFISPGPTGSDDPSLPPLPGIRLLQNYPNPFNPSTTISFALEDPARISLSIYNMRGQLVKTLCHNSLFEAGTQTLIWDGLDNDKRPVSSGIYFYRLSGPNTTLQKKMVLTK